MELVPFGFGHRHNQLSAGANGGDHLRLRPRWKSEPPEINAKARLLLLLLLVTLHGDITAVHSLDDDFGYAGEDLGGVSAHATAIAAAERLGTTLTAGRHEPKELRRFLDQNVGV